MATQDSFVAELIKKPGFTLGVSLLAGFGIGFLYERNKAKAQQQQQQKGRASSELPPSSKEPSGKEHQAPLKKYGELPNELIISIEELSTLMKQYLAYIQEKQVLEEIIPRAFKSDDDLRRIWDSMEHPKNGSDLVSLTKSISGPLWDLLDRGGLRWRPILCFIIAQAFERKIDEVIYLAHLIELLHSAIIMTEDIENNKEIRREKDAIHKIHGFDITLNTASLFYFVTWSSLLKKYERILPKDKVIKLMKIYIQEMTNVHIGQAWNLYWTHCDKVGHIPTEIQYLQMEAYKSGLLARLAARFLSEVLDLSRDAQKGLYRFNEKVGIAFQLHLDILDVLSDGKGEQITRGKMTLPIVHSLNTGTFEDRARLIEILKKKTQERSLIDEAISILNKSDSINYTRNKASSLIQEAWDDVKEYIPNNKFKGCLKTFAETFPAKLV